jgi:hypothetical protein
MLQEGSIINSIYCHAHNNSTHKNTNAITSHNKPEFRLTLFLQTFFEVWHGGPSGVPTLVP